MALNKQKGDMYPWITHTWNPIRGCIHDCAYCYLKSIPRFDMTPRLSEPCFSDKLGSGRTIFCGSSADMWCKRVPDEWIDRVLDYIVKYSDNDYLFQTKCPYRYLVYEDIMPSYRTNVILGTTIETNRPMTAYSKAPSPIARALPMAQLSGRGAKTMVSVEPIFDFDFDDFMDILVGIAPSFISFGAVTKGHEIPEPSPDKAWELIESLQEGEGMEVLVKPNFERRFGKTDFCKTDFCQMEMPI